MVRFKLYKAYINMPANNITSIRRRVFLREFTGFYDVVDGLDLYVSENVLSNWRKPSRIFLYREKLVQ